MTNESKPSKQPTGIVWAITDDSVAIRAIERVTAASSFDLMQKEPGYDPILRVVAVLSAEAIDAVEILSHIRENYPASYVIGFLESPDQNFWLEAERSGFNLVCSRGGLGPALRKTLSDDNLTSVDRGVAVCESANIAGRLGHLMDIDLPKLGEVSLWRVAGRLVCTGKCPHQKVSLGKGEIEETIVTCPGHGSRFDLLTGERVRGPSDFDLQCYGVYEQNGRVWVLPN